MNFLNSSLYNANYKVSYINVYLRQPATMALFIHKWGGSTRSGGEACGGIKKEENLMGEKKERKGS